MACSYWLIWSSQVCCYHQKEDFEIFKFKSFNHPSVSLQHYNFSTFGPAGMVKLRLIQDPQKSNQNIFHVVIGMSAVYWLITKYHTAGSL